MPVRTEIDTNADAVSNSTHGFSRLLNNSGSSGNSDRANQAVHQERFVQVPLQVQILDYSPEWDFTTGGSKIMFCIRPAIERIDDPDFERKFECSFGESIVPIKFI